MYPLMFYAKGVALGFFAVVLTYLTLTNKTIVQTVAVLWMFISRPDPSKGLHAIAQAGPVNWMFPLLHRPWFWVVAMDVFAAVFTVYWLVSRRA